MIDDLLKLKEDIFWLKRCLVDLNDHQDEGKIDLSELKTSIKELKNKASLAKLNWVEPEIHSKQMTKYAIIHGQYADLELFMIGGSCWSIFKLHKSPPGMSNLSSDCLEQYKMFMYANELQGK